MSTETITPRSRILQHPKRQVTEEVEILKAGYVAHVGFIADGKPCVIPFSYQYDGTQGDKLYIHGGPASQTLVGLSAEAPVCVTVTLVDGLVYSKTALYHSINYRSVVCYGTARLIEEQERKAELFDSMIGRFYPGRTAGRDYEAPTANHLAATAMVEVSIERWSAKTRRGSPKGPHDDNPEAPGTSGVVLLGGS